MAVRKSNVYIFTGEAKGKTTAAMGLALQAAAEQRMVTVVQFLKGGGYTGELFAAAWLAPYFTIRQFGYGCPIAEKIKSGEKLCNKCGQCFRENRNPDNGFAPLALAFAAKVLAGGQVDMLVMDEISHAVRHRLISLADVINLVKHRPTGVDIVLTGRYMPEELMAIADQITVCKVVKHPITQGIDARRGIEY